MTGEPELRNGRSLRATMILLGSKKAPPAAGLSYQQLRDPSTRENYALAREASVLDRNRQPNRSQENSRQTSTNEWAEDWHDGVAPAGRAFAGDG
jgi:hypothetical protein